MLSILPHERRCGESTKLFDGSYYELANVLFKYGGGLVAVYQPVDGSRDRLGHAATTAEVGSSRHRILGKKENQYDKIVCCYQHST